MVAGCVKRTRKVKFVLAMDAKSGYNKFQQTHKAAIRGEKMPTRSWLRELRGSRSQREMAREIGISRTYLSQLEQGQRNPAPELAKKMAVKLGVDWPKFFEEGEPGDTAEVAE
jgi:putative transcriptional regulator